MTNSNLVLYPIDGVALQPTRSFQTGAVPFWIATGAGEARLDLGATLSGRLEFGSLLTSPVKHSQLDRPIKVSLTGAGTPLAITLGRFGG